MRPSARAGASALSTMRCRSSGATPANAFERTNTSRWSMVPVMSYTRTSASGIVWRSIAAICWSITERPVYDPAPAGTRRRSVGQDSERDRASGSACRYVQGMMPKPDRARLVAPALLAAVAGSASVGIAAVAREGLCFHRLTGLTRADAMPGMSMDPTAMAGIAAPAPMAPCPILLWAALAAGVFYLLAMAAIALARPSAPEIALATARLVLGIRFAPLAALLVVAGAVPLGATIALEGHAGGVLLIAAAFVVVAALLAAYLLLGAARCIIALACRIADAMIEAFRLLVPGGDAPWLARRALVLVPAGVRVLRRRPSRAPPLAH